MVPQIENLAHCADFELPNTGQIKVQQRFICHGGNMKAEIVGAKWKVK